MPTRQRVSLHLTLTLATILTAAHALADSAGWQDGLALFESFGVFEAPGSEAPATEEQRLEAALADLYHLADLGGWPTVGHGPLLKPGAHDGRMPTLRRRLALPPVDGPDSTRFDPDLVAAVRRFQARHGLAPDGLLGPATVAALDVSATDRARQIALNLERRSWLPPDRGSRHVLVNVPAGTLAMIDADSLRGVMRAVVGRRERPTPSLASTITTLEFNPVWNIPARLARLDVLPNLRKDPQYWRVHNIRVFASWQNGAPELDPAQIDWSAIRPRDLAYKLRQEPGPLNPLGRLKVLFDNPYSVFIHDTPSRERFNAPARFYSSGCVRIEDPDGLAAFLLEGADVRVQERVAAARAATDTRFVRLSQPVPVYMVYWTAWVDPDGTLQFRDDIYGHDGQLAASLFSAPAPVVAASSPLPDRTGVEVHEVGTRIVADPAALFPQGGAPQDGRLDPR